MNRDQASFLKSVDEDKNKVYYARIAVLDKLEKPIKSIEGRVLEGSSLSVNGSSSMRRTCTLNLIAEEEENDLTNIENFLSINKKVKLEVGLKYNVDFKKDVYKVSTLPTKGEVGKIYILKPDMTFWYWSDDSYFQIDSIFKYPDTIVWFPLGVFVITQPSLSHNTSSVNISLNLKDKMCLLNGEMGGGLPTSITFHEYDQAIGEVVCESDPRTDDDLYGNLNEYTIYNYNGNYYKWSRKYGWEETDGNEIGTIAHIPQLFYDIIQTVVIRWGNESPSRVIVNDVPREIKQLVRWTSASPLYHNTATGVYTTDELYLTNEGTWRTFKFNDDVGYVYTDFVYPGELITNIGDNVCSVLDKIIGSETK
jgi:hypothetical protein